MSNSPAPAPQRVADYFFVAGLHDTHIIPAFENAKRTHTYSEDDITYYQQQECAVNSNNFDLIVKSGGAKDNDGNRGSVMMPITEDNLTEKRNKKRSLSHRCRSATISVVSPTKLNANDDEEEEPARPPNFSASTSTRNIFLHTDDEDDDGLDTPPSLLGVLDHVQSVIDNFDKERDTARDNVIAPFKEKKFSNTRASIYSSTNRRKSSFYMDGTLKGRWRSPSESKLYSKRFSVRTLSDLTATSKDDTSKQMIPNIFDIKYTPTVLSRYPQTNYSEEEPFPAYAAMFCFPRDIQLYYGEKPPNEQCHSFTMTDETGATIYGSCVVFYEKLPDKLKEPVNNAIQEWVKHNMTASTIEYAQHLRGKIDLETIQLAQARKDFAQVLGETHEDSNQKREEVEERIRTCQENIELYRELLEPVKLGVCTAEEVWVPKSVGLLGRMPWIDLYGDWLKILLDNIVGVGGHRHVQKVPINIENVVTNFIDEVPLPPPGRFEIGLTINGRPLFFSRPPMNQVPILKNFSLYPLLRALSPHLILAVVETLLAEGKVLFLSQYPGMLSLACEAFRYLLFPFYWQFVFIPVLPERLLTCLQAPVPYMIGFKGTMTDLDDNMPDDACIVNLDSNSMHQSQRVMTIPDRQRRKLQSAFEQYAPLHTKCRIPYGVPEPIKCAYPKGKMLLNCTRSKSSAILVNPIGSSSHSQHSQHLQARQQQQHHHLRRGFGSINSNSNGYNRRDSIDSADTTTSSSMWSHSASLLSKPSTFWTTASSAATGRSSNDSSTTTSISTSAAASTTASTINMKGIPQYPGSAILSTGSIGNYGSSSTPSLQSPPVSPMRATAAVPASINNGTINSMSSGRPGTLMSTDHQHSYSKATDLPALQSNYSSDMSTKSKFSSLMSKPRAVFQHHIEHTPSSSIEPQHNTTASSVPRLSINVENYQSSYDQAYTIPRAAKHMEGHIMTEILPSEAQRYQGYRCVCGKQVTEEEGSEHSFMSCQECHLVTHERCTDQILHPCLPACFNEQKIQDAFIRMFASLLYNYRSGFVSNGPNNGGGSSSNNINSNNSFLDASSSTTSVSAQSNSINPQQAQMASCNSRKGSTYFSKDKFLKHCDKDTKAFLTNLCNSQMFTQFITDRLVKPPQDPEILVFDEYIKLKLNRSKLKFVKEETPFLNDDSYRVSQIIWAAPPHQPPLTEPSIEFKRFPTTLNFSKKTENDNTTEPITTTTTTTPTTITSSSIQPSTVDVEQHHTTALT